MEKVYQKVPIDKQQQDAPYWRTQPYRVRLAALEQIRREYHQWRYGSEPGFQRVYTIVKHNRVRYLIIGGYAVALHGYPRYTKDLDVWVEMSETNAARIIAALDEFGFASLGLQPSDFLEPNQVIQLGHPPNRIDIIMAPKGIEFDACYEDRVVVEIDEIPFNFIDLPNLLKNKRATGRHQDLADVENLEP